MIITALKGGLGNQMFQYALGRQLAISNNTRLKLDLSYYEKQDSFRADFQRRGYELDIFNIKAEIANTRDLKRIKHPTLVDKIMGNQFREYKDDPSMMFMPSLLSLRGNLYFNGYWQAEKYFEDISFELAEEFSWKESPQGKDAEVIAEIESDISPVGLHIRRSDYITDANANKVHGVAGIDYYQRGISFIQEKYPDSSYYIFSDDPEWTRENIKIPERKVVYVTHNPIEKGYQDMRIMTFCHHFVIANSTFSWWGAWLAERQHTMIEHTVVAPRAWFSDPSKSNEDIIPDHWKKL